MDIGKAVNREDFRWRLFDTEKTNVVKRSRIMYPDYMRRVATF